MIDVTTLQAAQEKAFGLYQTAKKNLEIAANSLDPTELALAAQAANDAWLEFKKMDNEVTNGLILKKLGDLYHA